MAEVVLRRLSFLALLSAIVVLISPSSVAKDAPTTTAAVPLPKPATAPKPSVLTPHITFPPAPSVPSPLPARQTRKRRDEKEKRPKVDDEVQGGGPPLLAKWDPPPPPPTGSGGVGSYNNKMMNMTRVKEITAECQDDFMKILLTFNGSFSGLIYSSGYSYDKDCVYINGTGRNTYEFYIQLNRCGTLGGSNRQEKVKQNSKSYMWNTVTVQYNSMIEEEWDEHFKVTCEYGYDYWKTVTFPVLDVQVATGNPVVFTLPPPECTMDIIFGYGLTGGTISGPVRVGDPLTLVITMRSQYEGFDIVINNCYAHNGAEKRIPLIDRYGCPVDEKLISSFQGTWTKEGKFETNVYAYMKAFRFTGSPALYLECEVRMCHGFCPSQPCHWRVTGRRTKRSSVDEDHLLERMVPIGISLPDDEQSLIPRSMRALFNEDLSDHEVEENSTVSDSLVLFQALQVINDDQRGSDPTESQQSQAPQNVLTRDETVCLKQGVFSAVLAAAGLVFIFLISLSCFLLKRRKTDFTDSSSLTAQIYKKDFLPPNKFSKP